MGWGRGVGRGVEGSILSEKLPVSQGDSSRTIDPYPVLIILKYLDNLPCSFPPARVVPDLVLDVDKVAYLESRQAPDMFGPSLMAERVALGHSFFTVVHQLFPCVMWGVFSNWDGNHISNLSSKEHQCW